VDLRGLYKPWISWPGERGDLRGGGVGFLKREYDQGKMAIDVK